MMVDFKNHEVSTGKSGLLFYNVLKATLPGWFFFVLPNYTLIDAMYSTDWMWSLAVRRFRLKNTFRMGHIFLNTQEIYEKVSGTSMAV